jgi:1-acyl-sn-glycerol-3-phosphate acyltransferase
VIFLRSLLYNIVFYLNLGVLLIGCLPTFLMKRHGIIYMAQLWGLSSQWWLRLICGTKLEIRGLEKIPQGGFIVGSKHQSTYETFRLMAMFPDPAFIIKRELQWIPMFGWLTITAEMIPINRSAGAQAVPQMMRLARRAVEAGRQLIIFPEGTRRPVDAPPAYKFGMSRIYDDLKVPVVPIALNAGLYWPRRKFLRFPGTIIIEILDPIPAGLPPKEFMARLENVIETASDRLLAEGRAQPEYQAAVKQVS